MKHLLLPIAIVILSGVTFGQLYQGPAAGSVSGGASTSTDNFPSSPVSPEPVVIPNRTIVEPLPDPADLPPPTGPEGSNYYVDPSVSTRLPLSPPPITISTFFGIPQTNSIPPDPYVAVGPNHIMQVVNTSFRISDKQGNTLKTIGATAWFNNVFNNSGAFDPKVHYDHYAGRWIMVWLQLNDNTQTANYLVSVSDDNNPLGTWYNWALPSNVNGTTPSGNWADYQGVGFDEQALYFTSNQFAFTGGFNYVKVRVMPKAQFYNNDAGPITWYDFWDLRDANGNGVFGTRPVRSYGYAGTGFLVGPSPFTTGTYFILYRVHNPTTSTPSITAVHIPVTAWNSPPNANQLGGGTLLIEAGGSGLRNEPIYKDSAIWAVHAIRSGTGGQYSSVRYLRFNIVNNTATEDVAFGVDGYWHFYPALQVDKDNNIAITFSRSANTEYAGAYFTWRLQSDPPGLRPSETIQAGKANYVKDFGSGRNRWGDYMGIALDPVDRNHIWMLTEYAEFPAHTWGIWVHGTRLVPFPGSRLALSRTTIDFGSREAGVTNDTVLFTLYNYGINPLSVSSIVNANPTFTLVNLPSFPATISTFDSIVVGVVFSPTTHGTVLDSITITSNDSLSSTHRVSLRGKGVVIGQAQAGVMYATSGVPSTSQLYTIHSRTGAATAIGPTQVTEIHGLTVRPTTKELYGSYTTASNTVIYRLSSGYGDALPVRTIPLANMRAIAFNAGDTLYGATTTGRLYRLNLTTGDTAYVGTASGIVYSSLSFHPLTGVLWASVRPSVINRDRIYTINTSDGSATLVGSTGFNLITPHIAFDALGNLYGIIRTGTTVNDLISIDTDSARGSIIGSTGVFGLQAIATRTDSVLNVRELPTEAIPTEYVLHQNYPNPFNPTTVIRYALPVFSRVRLSIFNVLGQEVVRLVDNEQTEGTYEAVWDGTTTTGVNVAGGLYFYSFEAHSEGTVFRDVKKMVLVK